MRVVVKTCYFFEDDDYKFVIKQLKDKKIKIKDFCSKCGFTRQHLSNVLHGKYEIPKNMILAFKDVEIVLPFRF